MSKPIISKVCTKCKFLKPITSFHKEHRVKDGHYAKCKICCLKHQKEYRHTGNGKIIQKKYQQSEKGKTVAKKYEQTQKGRINRSKTTKQYFLRHPNRRRARAAVNNAIRKNRLSKPTAQRCFCCPDNAIHYHHHLGYAPVHWLHIIPVCTECHIIIHS